MQVPLGSLIESSASIPISTTTSGVVTTNGMSLVGIQVPAAFTGTALTFLVSDSATGSFFPLYNSAGAVSYTVAPSRWLAVDPKDFASAQFFKIVSGSTEIAARVLNLMLKGQ